MVVKALGRGVRQPRERLEGRVRLREVFRQAAGVVHQHSHGDRVTAFSDWVPSGTPSAMAQALREGDITVSLRDKPKRRKRAE
jgi:hypothetical protein